MSDETKTTTERINKAVAEEVENLICEAVEDALDLAWKAHNPGEDFREWLKAVREQAAKGERLSPIGAAFIARYLA